MCCRYWTEESPELRPIVEEMNRSPLMKKWQGSPGIVTPKAMAMIAPRLAPEETPRVDPSASGFFKRPCMAAPPRLRLAPTMATHSTRGSRTGRMMEAASLYSVCGAPVRALTMQRTVAFSGSETLPTQMHSSSTAAVMTAKMM